MFHLITSITDKLISYIKDDPVRPDISAEYRVQNNRFIATLVDQDIPSSMVCISLHDFIPESVTDLDNTSALPTTAVFYTVWSYKPGAGRDLIFQAVPRLKEIYPTVTTFVTLSPKTEMARRFHLKNGAVVFRENTDSINYRYNQST